MCLLSLRVCLFVAGFDLTPTDQSEQSVEFAREGDLVADLRAYKLGQHDPRLLASDSHHISTATCRADINEEHLVLLNVLDTITAVFGADDALKDGRFDVDLDENLGHAVRVADNAPDHVVRAGELRVNLGAHGDQPAWDGVHQIVVVGFERHHDRLDLGPGCFTRSLALGDLTGADGDFVADLEAAFENGAASDSAFERLCVLSRLVHVKGANDNHVGRHGELACGDGDPTQVVNDDVDVVSEHGGDGNDGDLRASSRGKRLFNLVLLVRHSRLILNHQVNFVLQDYNMLKFHNIDSNQMLSGLRLWVWLISCHQE